MAKTTANCSQCHQPVVVELNRLFDLNTDPEAKQKLLSGINNFITCSNCGYQGPLPTPIVYHDPGKELLLTFFPPEAGVPFNEQEKIIGPFIKKVVDDLPPEKRKAYLFQPKTMLTQQRLFEQILEADGITPEMMKAQQDRLNLIQRLAMTSEEAIPQAIKQGEALIDNQLFILLSQLISASAASGDETSAKQLATLQQKLVEYSEFGQNLQQQSQETQKAISDLQEASKKGLSRQVLLDLLINAAESEIQLSTLVSMTRSGLDYTFFQLMSDHIDKMEGEESQKLVVLRDKLLDMTYEIDKAVKAQTLQAQQLLDELLKAENTEEAAQQALPKMTQIFLEILGQEIQNARSSDDQPESEKLQQIAKTIQKASASAAYIELIEALIQAPDETAMSTILEKHKDDINDEFLQFLTSLTTQIETQKNQPETIQRLKDVYHSVLRFSMKQNMNQAS